MWSAKIYAEFLDLRTRPVRELLNAIPSGFMPKVVYDLGCGPGNSTILLKQRFDDADITGIDSSIDMIKEAAAQYPDLHFKQMAIEEFNPLKKVDLIFANASMQWVSQHEVLFSRLCAMLNSGGIIAIQIPNNFHAPTHQLVLRLFEMQQTWQIFLKKLIYGRLTKPLYDPFFYYDVLVNVGCREVLCWETDYFQEMDNHEAIFHWMSGTTLRFILTSMDSVSGGQFASAYIETLRNAYPMQANGKILLPYKRLFMIGMM